MKKLKSAIDAKYQDLELWQMKQIDDCLKTLRTENITTADRLHYLKESIAEVREKRWTESSTLKLAKPEYSEKV